MQRYGVAVYYIQLPDTNLNKVATMYIDGRPKSFENIVEFINSTRLGTTHKLPNCIFEGHEGNHVFVCTTKSLVAGEELID